MRRALIILTIVVILVVPCLSGRSCAADNGAKISSEIKAADEEAAKTAEAKKEEEKKAVEAAKIIIVAKVNGADINMFMLTRAMNIIAPKYVKKGEATTPEVTARIKKEALDRLIFEEMAVQQAIREDINPMPEAIDKVVKQIKENLGSEQAYREYLDKSYLSEDNLRKMIERSQRFELITATEVYGKVKVNERLIHDEYEKEKGRFVLPDIFLVEDVYFLQGNDEEAIRKKADGVLKTIKQRDNDVWKLVLDGSFIVKKTNVTQAREPEIYKAVTGMKVGDLSSVIKDKDGFHIIKIIKKEPSRQLAFEEAKSAIEPKFLVPAQNQRKKEWTEELKQNAKIEILIDEGVKTRQQNGTEQNS